MSSILDRLQYAIYCVPLCPTIVYQLIPSCLAVVNTSTIFNDTVEDFFIGILKVHSGATSRHPIIVRMGEGDIVVRFVSKAFARAFRIMIAEGVRRALCA